MCFPDCEASALQPLTLWTRKHLERVKMLERKYGGEEGMLLVSGWGAVVDALGEKSGTP